MSVNSTPPAEKSTTERQLEKAIQRVEELKARRKAEIRAQRKVDRNRRTRQIIKIGAIIAKYFNIDPLKDDPAEVERFLQKNVLFAENITHDSATPINIIDLWREFVKEEKGRKQNGE